ncbi:MAG: hypothetical protein ACREKL_12120 [Chthoniobacterales bacterium]
MNDETSDEPTNDSLRRKGGELASATQERVGDALSEIETRIRKNPWIFIGGALLIGGAIAALCPRHRREPEKLEVVRDWLRHAYENVADRMPDRSDVQSAVESLDLPGRINCLRRKLHIG